MTPNGIQQLERLRSAVDRAIGSLSSEQQQNWSEIHPHHITSGTAEIWQWTPEQSQAIAYAVRDFVLSSPSPSDALHALRYWSSRAAATVALFVARDAYSRAIGLPWRGDVSIPGSRILSSAEECLSGDISSEQLFNIWNWDVEDATFRSYDSRSYAERLEKRTRAVDMVTSAAFLCCAKKATGSIDSRIEDELNKFLRRFQMEGDAATQLEAIGNAIFPALAHAAEALSRRLLTVADNALVGRRKTTIYVSPDPYIVGSFCYRCEREGCLPMTRGPADSVEIARMTGESMLLGLQDQARFDESGSHPPLPPK